MHADHYVKISKVKLNTLVMFGIGLGWNYTPVWCMHVKIMTLTEENAQSLVSQTVQPTQKKSSNYHVLYLGNCNTCLTHACMTNSIVTIFNL